jgi:calcium/calmodulin-dependent protein kinase I
MAPEVIQKQGHGKSVDLWAIGCLLLSGYLPFESQSSVAEVENIVKGVYSFDDLSWDDISLEAKDFICKLLLVDPLKRMTIEEALVHPWLKRVDEKPVKDLFPKVRKGFISHKMLKKAALPLLPFKGYLVISYPDKNDFYSFNQVFRI